MVARVQCQRPTPHAGFLRFGGSARRRTSAVRKEMLPRHAKVVVLENLSFRVTRKPWFWQKLPFCATRKPCF